MVDRLQALDDNPDVLLESMVIHPPVDQDLSHLPEDWQEFYQACDGIQVRWKHRLDGMVQQELGTKPFSKLRKKAKPISIKKVGADQTGIIEIPSYKKAFGKNKDYADYVESAVPNLEGATAALDGKEVALAELMRSSTPFESFVDNCTHVMRRQDDHRLFWSSDYWADMRFDKAVDLSTYLQMLTQHLGQRSRRQDLFDEGVRDIDLSDAAQLLGRDHQPSLSDFQSPEALWAFLDSEDDHSDRYYLLESSAKNYFRECPAESTHAFLTHALKNLRPKEFSPMMDVLITIVRFHTDDFTDEHWASLWPLLDAWAGRPLENVLDSNHHISLLALYDEKERAEGEGLCRQAEQAGQDKMVEDAVQKNEGFVLIARFIPYSRAMKKAEAMGANASSISALEKAYEAEGTKPQ